MGRLVFCYGDHKNFKILKKILSARSLPISYSVKGLLSIGDRKTFKRRITGALKLDTVETTEFYLSGFKHTAKQHVSLV